MAACDCEGLINSLGFTRKGILALLHCIKYCNVLKMSDKQKKIFYLMYDDSNRIVLKL